MPSLALRRRGAAWCAALGLAAAAQAQEEVPYITTPDNVTLEMLRVAEVRAGDHVIDLGSGDGRIVILAARRFGASGLGVEIDPQLVRLSNANARTAGVADRVSFREQDLFQTPLDAATVVTMYLLPDVNLALRPRLLALKPGTRIVSHDWDLGDWQPDQTTVVPVPDKKVGLEKTSKVHLWHVPARIDGLWCGDGALRGYSLRVTQKYQQFDGLLARGDRVRVLRGRVKGASLTAQSEGRGALAADVVDQQLRITDGDGRLALLRGQGFRRTVADSCT